MYQVHIMIGFKVLTIFVFLTIFDKACLQTVNNVCFCVTAGSCATIGTGGGVTNPPGGGNDGTGSL